MIDELLEKVAGFGPCYKLEANGDLVEIKIMAGYYFHKTTIDAIMNKVKTIAKTSSIEFEIFENYSEAHKIEIKFSCVLEEIKLKL